jgi:hypothetical protein
MKFLPQKLFTECPKLSRISLELRIFPEVTSVISGAIEGYLQRVPTSIFPGGAINSFAT